MGQHLLLMLTSALLANTLGHPVADPLVRAPSTSTVVTFLDRFL